MDDTRPALSAHGITKSFPGVRALDGVDLSVAPGEVLAVIGENGAGKSTLMKILAGIQRADAGTVEVAGSPVLIDSTRRARELGIALIHQELNLADNLDAGSNIFLGREPTRFGRIRHAEIALRSRDVLESVGADFGPETLTGTLSVGRKQLIEVAKALSEDARVLIMDEPTSSLTMRETKKLFEVVRDLSARGVSVIYISHRLGEVTELADRVTVLRDGRNSGELARSEIERDAMVRLMVGRDVEMTRTRVSTGSERRVLEVRDLVVATHPRESLGFEVCAGEKVGIAGLVGAGRTELLLTLFGVTPRASGAVSIDGRDVSLSNPNEAIAAGVALVPEDRKERGLILDWSFAPNVGLAVLPRHARHGTVDNRRERSLADELQSALRIKVAAADQPVEKLSGGNQQKVCIAKWLALEPKLLLLDEPTRGIDVGARDEIYDLIDDLAGKGVAILFASSEMEEILQLSDRVLVMHEGRLAGELSREELSEEAVMRLATGGEA